MASLNEVEQIAYMPFDPVIKRTEGTLRSKGSTQQFKTTKGAPHVILALVVIVYNHVLFFKSLCLRVYRLLPAYLWKISIT
jgi:hypothetical protein